MSVDVAANAAVPTAPTVSKKTDFWNAVDSEGSGGSLALPYYSTILHDPNRSSPFYQEPPVVANSPSQVGQLLISSFFSNLSLIRFPYNLLYILTQRPFMLKFGIHRL